MFTLKPRTADEQLREVATGSVLIPAEGTVEISLTQFNPRRGVPSGEGHLELACSRGDIRLSTYPWSCSVRVPDGGIQLRSSMDFDFAPESGYQPSIELGFDAESPDWRDRTNEDVFVRLADGNYAFITLKIRTRGDYYAVVNGVLNEHGSRLID